MEYIFEIIFETYVELMLLIVPEEKVRTKKYKVLISIFAFSVLLGVFALFIWGSVLISDYNNKLGIIPIIIAIVISMSQIIAGFILHNKK